ncbi:LysM peptidoglycan-binding domain-containing protein [Pseudarthrobacter sp. NPDC058329]|uniref:LysM peptidoglycan-binding domain-containing protein n=1 Tax=Pseudarthrobacter sp. NPDC058329 TaxID=3346448 RepID=UPI0036DAA788
MIQTAEHARWTDAVTAAAILMLGVLLYAAGSGILVQWQQSSARHQELQTEHLLGAAAAAGGAALVGWWFLALLFAGATTLLERKGKSRAAAVTRKLSPALMQRLVLAALSVQLVTGPAANAHAALSGPEWTPIQDYTASAQATSGSHTHDVLPTPATEDASEAASTGSTEHPTPPAEDSARQEQNSQVSPRGEEHNVVQPAPVVLEVDSGTSSAPPSRIRPGWQPGAPVPGPGLLAAPELRAAGKAPAEAGAVTVLAGDTLWDVAAHAMGPGASDVDIAMLWPRWYEANRALIGQDPDVLLPGQILQPPSAA